MCVAFRSTLTVLLQFYVKNYEREKNNKVFKAEKMLSVTDLFIYVCMYVCIEITSPLIQLTPGSCFGQTSVLRLGQRNVWL